MREIKFRGKQKGGGWVYGDLLHEPYGTCIQWAGRLPNDSFSRIKAVIIPGTVGQYIGLEDINGKEIYEGDIVEVKDPYPTGVRMFTGVVMFGSGSFMIKSSVGEHYRWLDYEVEVIGNVYENPELLEEHL